MIRVGKYPYLECSSQGDHRFSAFYAKPASLRGYTIEQAYQAMKVFEGGVTGLSIRDAKGRKPLNIDDCYSCYVDWFHEWVLQEDLIPVLTAASGLSDQYGQKGHTCQALVLWDIRSSYL